MSPIPGSGLLQDAYSEVLPSLLGCHSRFQEAQRSSVASDDAESQKGHSAKLRGSPILAMPSAPADWMGNPPVE